jgi:putative tryptophan/tyrosine transport system substrate-binding protein
MRRREFIGLIGAAAWPIKALAQQAPRYPNIAFITTAASKDDVEMRGRVRAFESAWPELGWVEGRNIHVHFRWGEASQIRAVVAERVASAPDVIVANGTSVLNAVRQATNAIPVVFTGISDPEGVGIVANLARPGGNMTGLANFEPSMAGNAQGNRTQPDPRRCPPCNRNAGENFAKHQGLRNFERNRSSRLPGAR